MRNPLRCKPLQQSCSPDLASRSYHAYNLFVVAYKRKGQAMSHANVRELHIMSILLNGERFGRQVNLEYEKLTGKRMPIGSLYTTLDRMQDKGYIKSREGEPNPEYGGNRRRFFSLTGKGQRAFDEITMAFNQLGVSGG